MTEKYLKSIKNILSVLLAILLIYLASVLSTLLIPLVLALFIAILLHPVLLWFERKRWPFALSLTVVWATTLGLLWLFGTLIYQTALSIAEQKDYLLAQIDSKLEGMLVWVNNLPNVDVQADNFVELLGYFMSFDMILASSGEFAGILGSFTGLFFMTVFYLIGLLGGILQYEKYINYLSQGGSSEDKMLTAFEQVKSSIVTYMKVKFIISFLTGLGYYLVCLLFGIKFSLFWGFLAFILNFIPTVGSIVATIPPLLLAFIQFESFGAMLIFLILLLAIQNVMGNIVEPRMTGNKLSLNTIVVILGLVFWGYLWGVTGMILSVPMLVLTKVILSRVPDAQLFVRLMSGKEERR